MKVSSGTTCWKNSNNAEENVNWQYRTILFEYQKDGLLGDKYIDDEEMEKILNEQAEQGWELVSVASVQEGLLSFFKRIQPPVRKQQDVKEMRSPEPDLSRGPQPQASSGQKREPRKEPGQSENEHKIGPPGKKADTVGQIKIS